MLNAFISPGLSKPPDHLGRRCLQVVLSLTSPGKLGDVSWLQVAELASGKAEVPTHRWLQSPPLHHEVYPLPHPLKRTVTPPSPEELGDAKTCLILGIPYPPDALPHPAPSPSPGLAQNHSRASPVCLSPGSLALGRGSRTWGHLRAPVSMWPKTLILYLQAGPP